MNRSLKSTSYFNSGNKVKKIVVCVTGTCWWGSLMSRDTPRLAPAVLLKLAEEGVLPFCRSALSITFTGKRVTWISLSCYLSRNVHFGRSKDFKAFGVCILFFFSFFVKWYHTRTRDIPVLVQEFCGSWNRRRVLQHFPRARRLCGLIMEPRVWRRRFSFLPQRRATDDRDQNRRALLPPVRLVPV